MSVPQGSVLGPTLWNVAYDDILRLATPGGTTLIGFADDQAILIKKRDPQRLRANIGTTLVAIQDWMRSRRLELAAHKTEATLLKECRRGNLGGFDVMGCHIVFRDIIKYLGVTLDSRMSYGPHIRKVAAKAETTVAALTKLLHNIGGPGELKRRVLYNVACSAMLYAAPVWADAMAAAAYTCTLRSVQRKMALRISKAYITTSYDAAMVMASTPPIDLKAWEKKTTFHRREDRREAKREARQEVLDRWQEEWASSSKGAWTRVLIPDLRQWVTRKHGTTSYHLTQALTGHGCFRTFTCKIGKTEDDRCTYCGQTDSPQHTIFECERFMGLRLEVEEASDTQLTVDSIIKTMIEDIRHWNIIHAYITEIMTTKEQDERAREGHQ